MGMSATLDVSQEVTAICVVLQDGTQVAEAKVPTCPDAITDWLTERTEGLERVGMETGPLAVRLWNAITERHVSIICVDALHANGVLKMMPNKTDRHDASGLAQIIRTGWLKAAQIKSHDAYVNRAMLTAREALVGMRVRLENEIRGLLKTFGIMFGKRVGGFKRRAEEIIEGELAVAPELLPIFEAMMQARRDILARIAALDSRIRAVAGRHATVRLLITAPCVGPITAMAVVAAFDDASRFRRSSSAGAYLGLTPRRYESGEISRNGRVFDGKLALITNATDLAAADAVARYKALADIEIAPVHHRLPDRIRVHALICFLALLLYRVMRMRLKAKGHSASPRTALDLLARIQRHKARIGERAIEGLTNTISEQLKLFDTLNLPKPA